MVNYLHNLFCLTGIYSRRKPPNFQKRNGCLLMHAVCVSSACFPLRALGGASAGNGGRHAFLLPCAGKTTQGDNHAKDQHHGQEVRDLPLVAGQPRNFLLEQEALQGRVRQSRRLPRPQSLQQIRRQFLLTLGQVGKAAVKVAFRDLLHPFVFRFGD